MSVCRQDEGGGLLGLIRRTADKEGYVTWRVAGGGEGCRVGEGLVTSACAD